jgi:hypothetical protein
MLIFVLILLMNQNLQQNSPKKILERASFYSTSNNKFKKISKDFTNYQKTKINKLLSRIWHLVNVITLITQFSINNFS